MRIASSVGLVCMCALHVASVARAQSLADIARQEESRRKTLAQPGRVYTNEDLKPVPPPVAPAAPSEPAAAAAAAEQPGVAPAAGDPQPAAAAANDADAANDAGAPKDDGVPKTAAPATDAEPVKDKEYWSRRLTALQEQLDRDRTYAEALQSRVNALAADFVNRDDPAQRAVIERDRIKALGELDRLKQAIPQEQKAISDLLEDARRAGVPPGWLR